MRKGDMLIGSDEYEDMREIWQTFEYFKDDEPEEEPPTDGPQGGDTRVVNGRNQVYINGSWTDDGEAQ